MPSKLPMYATPALAAARHALLSHAGWDVEERGLFGAPEIKVVVGAEVHASMRKALAMLGFGRKRVVTMALFTFFGNGRQQSASAVFRQTV